MLTKKEAAEFLGVSERAIERYTKAGRLNPTHQKAETGGTLAMFNEKDLGKLKGELSQPRVQAIATRSDSPTRTPLALRDGAGGLVAEDPELILQQAIRDMRDKVPWMQNNVAQVMANEKLLGRSLEQQSTKLAELDSKVKAAIKMGRDDLATAYNGELQTTQQYVETTRAQLGAAKVASEKAKKFLDNYLIQMKKKSDEAMHLIAQSKQARMEEQLAQMMLSFQVGDDSSTFDDMREKISQMKKKTDEAMHLIAQSKQARMQEHLAQTMSSFQVGDDSSTFDDMREKISRRSEALRDAVTSPRVSLSEKLLLSIDEAAALSGLSAHHIREAIHSKKLKARIVGRGWRIKPDELRAYVKKL